MLDANHFTLHIEHQTIDNRIHALSQEIGRQIDPANTVIVTILKGALFFGADMIRRLDGVCRGDFIRLSSYGMSQHSSGTVQLVHDLQMDVENQDVVLLDDIFDSGRTMHCAAEHVRRLGARRVLSVALLAKHDGRTEFGKLDLAGFSVPPGFYVGYGLDWQGRYRGLPDIYRKSHDDA